MLNYKQLPDNDIYNRGDLTNDEEFLLRNTVNQLNVTVHQRNVRMVLAFMFCMLQLIFGTIGILSYVTISVSRIDAQFGLALFYTSALALSEGAIVAIVLWTIFGDKQLWPLHHDDYVENNFDQLSLHVIQFLCTFWVLWFVWFGYAATGGDLKFGTQNGEITSGYSLILVLISLISINNFVSRIFSFWTQIVGIQDMLVLQTPTPRKSNGLIYVDTKRKHLDENVING